MASEKKRFNLEELVAYEHAYGGKLNRKRQLQLIAFPVVMLGAYSYVLTQEVLVALVVATLMTRFPATLALLFDVVVPVSTVWSGIGS